MQELLGLPVQASAHAAEIDQMIVILHWLMLVLFVGWGIFFVYTLIRFRASALNAGGESRLGPPSEILTSGRPRGPPTL